MIADDGIDASALRLLPNAATGRALILNPAPAMTLSSEILALCDVVIPNEHEVEILGGVAESLRLVTSDAARDRRAAHAPRVIAVQPPRSSRAT